MRRQIEKNSINVYLYDVINNNVDCEALRKNLSDEYYVEIIDNRAVTNRGDLERAFVFLNENFPDRKNCEFKWLKESSFNRLCTHVLNGDIDRVSVLNPIDEYGRLATNLEGNEIVPVRYYIAEKGDLWRVPVERLDIIQDKFAFFNRDIMSDEAVLRGIDYVCRQIESYAHNDLEKIVLLDKLIRENVQFDYFVYSSEYNSWDPVEQYFYKGRCLQALLATRCSVCAGISLFSSLVLNRLNIPTRIVIGSVSEGHAWNEVMLDDKGYSCDFTFNLCFDKEHGKRYLLVQQPSKNHHSYNTNFSRLHTYDRDALSYAQERLKDVTIYWPSYTSRRSAEVVENSENVVKVKRRKATIIEDKSNE